MLAVLSFKEQLKGKTVFVKSNNITTVNCLNKFKGLTNRLHQISRAIWNLTAELEIKIRAVHLSRVKNIKADKLSNPDN